MMQHSNKVIAAGRSFKKAKAFSEEVDNKVVPQLIDVMSNDQYPDWLKEVDICVMCIEQKHPNFIKFCFQHHIHYIDISPSYESLSQVMVFDELAKKSQSSAVIGVGLSPGLSNLLASQLSNEMHQVEQIDTYLMLGIGEVHGHDGVNWLLYHIQKNYTLMENGLEKQVKPLSMVRDQHFIIVLANERHIDLTLPTNTSCNIQPT
ncbi:saccharopine dehydrogenase [Geomicrobium sp. JCM 19038]|nr:saccharopine dehydrogenase [Geomicrobium sp. JCM 19038]